MRISLFKAPMIGTAKREGHVVSAVSELLLEVEAGRRDAESPGRVCSTEAPTRLVVAQHATNSVTLVVVMAKSARFLAWLQWDRLMRARPFVLTKSAVGRTLADLGFILIFA